MLNTGNLPEVTSGFMWEIGSIRVDWEYHNRLEMLHKALCWRIHRAPSQEAYSSANRQLCHCLSTRFGHMGPAGRILCNSDQKGEKEMVSLQTKMCD